MAEEPIAEALWLRPIVRVADVVASRAPTSGTQRPVTGPPTAWAR